MKKFTTNAEKININKYSRKNYVIIFNTISLKGKLVLRSMSFLEV